MKKLFTRIALLILWAGILFFNCSKENLKQSLSFIATADMRYYAKEQYRSSQHFLGAVEAIKKIGEGSFMIVPGDFDPPWAVDEVIKKTLGDDYQWFPAPGNHDLEDPEYMEWLRSYNAKLPNIVNTGPSGSETTIYSFDWPDCHFVALNQYYDGKTDMGTDGDIVPELLAWLEQDLKATTQKYIFVFGHEPIVSMPDMDNGRIRHQGDSLDKYPNNAFRFHQLLLKYGVRAYICGHSHSASFANINGVWQIDVGHARGIEEDSAPTILFKMLEKFIAENRAEEKADRSIIQQYYEQNQKQVQKTLFYMKFFDVDEYKKITDDEGVNGLSRFYQDFKNGGEAKQKMIETFWENSEYRNSTFIKFYVMKNKVKVEIYRDDRKGGDYSLRHSLILD